MTTLTPELAALATTSGVAFLMLVAGVQKHVLEWRRRQRSCPACGRQIEHRVCSSCAARS